MEYKTLPMRTKSIQGREVTGIFAVHGNQDSYSDISHPGSFSKTIVESTPRVKFLWNHDYWGGPPVATVKSIREVTRDELGDLVLTLAPDATGGVEIVREYLDTPRGNELLKAVEAGAVDEMSYGYDAVKFDYAEINGSQVRNLREVRLWEVSDVIFGANPATAGSKNMMPFDFLLRQLEAAYKSFKAGARHSAKDIENLNAIHAMVVDLGATKCLGIADEEAGNDEGDDGKSRAESIALSLTLAKAGAFLLEL